MTLRRALTQLVSILLVALAIFWFIQVRAVPRNVVVVRDCENRYASARTMADTIAIDQQPLVFQSGRSRPGTCGALRRAGRLR